jgi:SAM-dependent methyltransferase
MADTTLLQLYQNTSKHSQYQVLPRRVQALLPQDRVSVKSRSEQERLDYLCSKLDVAGLRMADIGGNTGFFSFELLDRGAASVDYYEGNAEHCAFVSHAAHQLGLQDRLRTHHGYLHFEQPAIPTYDAVLLLNVLHHIGDDYGDKGTRIEQVHDSIVGALRAMSRHARHLVFQLGFNWQGDPKRPLFIHGTKAEVIELVAGVAQDYDTVAIGIAERHDGVVTYRDANPANLRRDDALGEFLNRPLFILRSRHFPAA